MIVIFFRACSDELGECFTYPEHVFSTSRKFFWQRKRFFPFQNCIFFDFHRLHGTSNFHLKQFETIKNLSQITSTPIKVEPSVVRACCLFLWIAVILKKCASTTSIQWRPIKKCFGRVKGKHLTKFWYLLRMLGLCQSLGVPKSTAIDFESGWISHSSRLRQ